MIHDSTVLKSTKCIGATIATVLLIQMIFLYFDQRRNGFNPRLCTEYVEAWREIDEETMTFVGNFGCDISPSTKFSGLWLNQFEGSEFFPNKGVDWRENSTEKIALGGRALELYQKENKRGLYRVEFFGRRSLKLIDHKQLIGVVGPHVVNVDKVISIEMIEQDDD